MRLIISPEFTIYNRSFSNSDFLCLCLLPYVAVASIVCTLMLIINSQLEAFRYFHNVWSIFFGNCQADWDDLVDKSICRAVSWTHVKEEVGKLAPHLTPDLHTTSTPKKHIKATNSDTYKMWLPFDNQWRKFLRSLDHVIINSSDHLNWISDPVGLEQGLNI